MKTGLVLEGGGMRGIYTAGVLDVFMEMGFSFDGVIGVSAGAIHGCSYLSNQKGRSIRYYKKYCKNPRFMSLRSWLKTGNVVEAEFCYHELPDKLDIYDHDAFRNCGTPFYTVCSNVETGMPEYMRVMDMRAQIDCLRASASLPYFSQLVEINGKKYLDGGCTDSIPVDAFRNMGYARNVVVLTRDASYRKKPEMRALAGLFYKKYPAFKEALLRRHEEYNRTVAHVAELEKSGEVFVIRPGIPLEIGRMENDPGIIQKTYDIGRSDAQTHADALRRWMEESKI
ncbi:MAG: patatin family protein [Clostridia bacterium]|nr:patatin family protein [Clostridia bacterium]